MENKSLHTHVDIVSRSKGASVIAKAAYNGRDKLRDEYYVKVHDYSKKMTLFFQKYSCRNIYLTRINRKSYFYFLPLVLF